MQTNNTLRTMLLGAALLAAGCASQSTHPAPTASNEASPIPEVADWRVIGTPAPGSKFAKLRPGLSHADVESLIGPPNRVASHQTGKAWIPFYYGKDAYRLETYYKGEGMLTFSGSVYGNTQGKLIGVTVNTAESGAP
ncbi:MAG: hypothetical protein QM661_12565 [Solimonas sp.]